MRDKNKSEQCWTLHPDLLAAQKLAYEPSGLICKNVRKESESVFDFNSEHNALLLEQAIPGDILKDHHPKAITDTINIYANVVKELATRPLIHKNNYTHTAT